MKGAIIKNLGLAIVAFGLVAVSFGQARPQASGGALGQRMKPGEVRELKKVPTEVKFEKFNTASLFPQVNRSITARGVRPSNPSVAHRFTRDITKEEAMKRQAAGAERIVTGGTTLVNNLVSETRFPGIGFTGSTPPDTHMAVGPNHIVQVVNTSLAFFNKKTGALEFLQPMSRTGFLRRAGDFVFDPRVVFDPDSQQFVVVVLDVDFNTGQSFFHIAISDDANPNGNWDIAKIDNTVNLSGDLRWGDYPSVTTSQRSYSITFNHFSFGSGGGVLSTLWVIRKGDFEIFSGGTGSFFVSMAKKYTAGPEVPMMAALTFPFLLGGFIPIDPTVELVALRDDQDPPTLESTAVDIPVFVPHFGGSETAGFNIDTIGDRMMDVSRTGDNILFAFSANIGPDADGYTNINFDQDEDRQTKVRWGEIQLNNWPVQPNAPALTQSGEVASTLGDKTSFLMPAIVKNTEGSVMLVMTECGETFTPKIVATARRATDPAGQMGAPQTFGTSANFTIENADDLVSRWGDYAGIGIDPVVPDVIWGSHELFANAGLRWRTEIFSLRIKTSVVANRQVKSVTTIFGTNTGGDINSFAAVDGNQFAILAEDVPGRGNYAGWEAVFDTTGLKDGARLNLALSANLEGISGFVYALNHQTGQFDLINTLRLKTTTTTTTQLFPTSFWTKYRNPGNGDMTVRVVALNTVRRRGVAPAAFTLNTDFGQITINEL
ncbi:hypothetical protein CCB80_14420 [Armatimonadetes bacterium Uphvl-Ar1]|nr:hypothetical protein CCB80_14420 [Armatimonadetes bacterium Uphvl-Ar1]